MVDICIILSTCSAVQRGRRQGHFHPSQVQAAPLHQSTQSTVSLTQPPVTTCTTSTNLTPPEMTTPSHPHMVAHTGMSLVSCQQALFPGSSQVPPSFPLQYGKQVMRSWEGPENKAIPKLYGALLVGPYCAEKIVSMWLCVGSAQSAVHITLLGLAVKGTW